MAVPRLTGKVIIVQGGQWGSESKGIATAHIADEELKGGRPVVAVRTGAINAGHTITIRRESRGGVTDTVVKMQQLPVAFINPLVPLVLGPGAMIHIPTLVREMQLIDRLMPESAPVARRVYIDPRAGIHEDFHMERSSQANRHHLIGATGKGCSEAIVSRIKDRGTGRFRTFADWLRTSQADSDLGVLQDINVADTVAHLNAYYDSGHAIILEATQGHLLDLLTGPYPYTTHKPTSPAQWLAEAGLSPTLNVEVALVMRTHPIRVAGNSGPMPGEISWPQLARTINEKLTQAKRAPLVAESAIALFESAVIEVARSGRYSLPSTSDGLDQHLWSGGDRLRHRVALSELHKDALQRIESNFPTDYLELSKLFEFTTVTNKLRRVANLDAGITHRTIIEARPTYVFLTFVNYGQPELWGATTADLSGEECPFTVEKFERCYNVPVRYFNTGPRFDQVHTR
jgi:adenylosuccinate synthase